MGFSSLPVIALVIFVSSGASALKCYRCVHATRFDLSELDEIDPTIVTAACSTGANISAEFAHECNDGDPILDVIRQAINGFSPEIDKKINSILDQLSPRLAKKPKQADFLCATLDVEMKLNLTDDGPLNIGVATSRTCIFKEDVLDASFCNRQTGNEFVDQMRTELTEEEVNEFVDGITAVWTNFLESSIGGCVCDKDLCVTKKPVTGGGGGNGSGVIEVFTPLAIVSAILSMVLFRN